MSIDKLKEKLENFPITAEEVLFLIYGEKWKDEKEPGKFIRVGRFIDVTDECLYVKIPEKYRISREEHERLYPEREYWDIDDLLGAGRADYIVCTKCKKIASISSSVFGCDKCSCGTVLYILGDY